VLVPVLHKHVAEHCCIVRAAAGRGYGDNGTETSKTLLSGVVSGINVSFSIGVVLAYQKTLVAVCFCKPV